jgi:hypothetical protein
MASHGHSFSNPNFQTIAARIAPKMGATKKSHSCARAAPPLKIAGPIAVSSPRAKDHSGNPQPKRYVNTINQPKHN